MRVSARYCMGRPPHSHARAIMGTITMTIFTTTTYRDSSDTRLTVLAKTVSLEPMKTDTVMSHQDRVVRLLVAIESNLSADLSRESLARQADFSPYHLHRIFRALVGEPVKEYVR